VGVVSTDIISKCVLLNARSLNNKLPEFHKLLSDNLSILFITESWLTDSVTNGMLDCSHSYNIYRKDRPHKQRGGGVISLVTINLQSHSIPIPSKFDTIEIVAFCVVTSVGNFRFIVVYRPPDFNKLGRDYMCLLKDCLVYLCDTDDTVFIVGDFNLPYINWESFDSPEDQIHSVFLDFSLKSGFNQFVNEATLGNNI